MMVADGNSFYHALQTRYEHRLSSGLSVTASYTWSHMIDDQAQSANRGAAAAQNPRNRGRAERANSVFDIRHRLVIGYVWELPFLKGSTGLAKTFLGGWSANGIVTLQTGLPFNVTQSGDSQNVDPAAARPNLVPGQQVVIPGSDSGSGSLVQYRRLFPKRLRVWQFAQKPAVRAGSEDIQSLGDEGIQHALPGGSSTHISGRVLQRFQHPAI